MEQSITEPVSGDKYSLEHLRPRTVSYNIKVNKEPKTVTLQVHFSPHCFSRTKNDDDPPESVILEEVRRGGNIERRVFCPQRWEFSKNLPEIIEQLHHKGCLVGGGEIFYRQENAPLQGAHEGWYICARLSASKKYQNLTMSIRSVHYRQNRPVDIRGRGVTKFYVILERFYRSASQTHDWLD